MNNQNRTSDPPHRFRLPRLRARYCMLIGLFALLYGAMLISVRPLAANQPEPGADASSTQQQPMIVRIRAETPDEALQLIAQGIDLLEARDGPDLFALVTADQQAALVADGWDVRVDPAQTAQLRGAQLQAFRGGYRTVEEIELFLQTMATRYPHLTTLVDFGDSWERQQFGQPSGYDLWALRLTHKATPGPKPVFFLMAAIHPRELTVSEVATRFIEHLLTNYGTDPDITWMLNDHEIVIVPMLNPDGHKLAEQGLSQRKNTNNTNGGQCLVPPQRWSQFGVDLNRNFATAWGTVNTPDTNPCSLVYPGSAPASEPETQALQAFLRELYPQRSGLRPIEGVAAAPNTPGLLITLHSYSDLVLWPWGHSSDGAPNEVGLARLGRQLGNLTGYEPTQSINLYPTSGTTDDWSYGELGIASYTFEIGSFGGTCGGFMPPYACLDGLDGRNFWQENLPALLHAARVARAPYTQPAGPTITEVQLEAGTETITLTATIDGGTQPITATEVYLNESPWQGGSALELQPVDGAFDAPREQAQIVLPQDLPPEAQQPAPLLLIRAQHATGTWGPIRATWMQAMTSYQYWFPLAGSR